jgi:predicted transcriptional regulator
VAQFGELEAAIMDEVWAADGPVTVREVVDRFQRDRKIAYTTVQTVTEILVRKGWLSRAKDGRAFRYTALASRDEYTARLIDEALEASPDRTAALAHFLADRLDDEQAAELRKALTRARSGTDASKDPVS